MNWKRKAEQAGGAGGKANSSTKRRRAPAKKQLVAGLRWMVSSWVTPAASDARWEQTQDCSGAPRAPGESQ